MNSLNSLAHSGNSPHCQRCNASSRSCLFASDVSTPSAHPGNEAFDQSGFAPEFQPKFTLRLRPFSLRAQENKMSNEFERDFVLELEQNKGKIFLPDGTWGEPIRPHLREWDGDVYCYPREEIEDPAFEQKFGVFIASAVNTGDCKPSGAGRVHFVIKHATYLATGDFFDWNCVYVDRETLHGPNEEDDPYDPYAYLGKSSRRTMNSLKQKVQVPRESMVQEQLLKRMSLYAWAWKVYLGRAGFPQFSESRIFGS